MRILATIVLMHIWVFALGQNKENKPPKFFSESTAETEFEDCLIISKYYSLKDNITNRKSSAFLSDSPSLNQIEMTMGSLSSDYFILTKNHQIIAEITILEKQINQFKIVLQSTNSEIFELCELDGDITENRANEILQNNYDANASIKDGVLNFNGKQFQVVTNEAMIVAVKAVIVKRNVHKLMPSKKILMSDSQMTAFILKQSKEGNKMDFFSEIKGVEDEVISVTPEIHATKSGMALYKWGKSCADLGVNSVYQAYEIFEAYKGRPLYRKERDYIKFGFNRAFK